MGNIVVFLVVALCFLFFIGHIWKSLKGENKCGSCPSAEECSNFENKEKK